MTDNGAAEAALEPLPTVVRINQAVMEVMGRRLPSPELLDTLERAGAPAFEELMQTAQGKFRWAAFRRLVEDYPLRDKTSLWLHAYFCEIEISEEPAPLETASSPTSPPSVVTTAASHAMSRN